jgi:hypothetical protein
MKKENRLWIQINKGKILFRKLYDRGRFIYACTRKGEIPPVPEKRITDPRGWLEEWLIIATVEQAETIFRLAERFGVYLRVGRTIALAKERAKAVAATPQ